MRNRIAIFIPTMAGGGAERAAVSLANGFNGRGIPVDLLACNFEGPSARGIAPGVELVDLNSGGALGALIPLCRYLHRSRPTTLISSLTHSNVVALIAGLISFSKIQVFVVEQSSPARHRSSIMGRILLSFMQVIYPLSSRVIACSRDVASQLRSYANLSESKIAVIENSIDIEEIHSKATANDKLSLLPQLAEGSKIIVAAGRLVEEKGFSTLLKAFASPVIDNSARLVILGQGPLELALRDEARTLGVYDRVVFSGFVENPYVWMKQADVFVLSSVTEGLPTVLIEALSLGKKVVSTRCCGSVMEILGDGKYGRIVEVNDSVSLASGIDAAMKGARLSVPPSHFQRYEREHQVDRYLELMKQ